MGKKIYVRKMKGAKKPLAIRALNQQHCPEARREKTKG